eukprot:1161133-Pelagomonas_calceolata.AAC.2
MEASCLSTVASQEPQQMSQLLNVDSIGRGDGCTAGWQERASHGSARLDCSKANHINGSRTRNVHVVAPPIVFLAVSNNHGIEIGWMCSNN